ncbi:MAG: hypothetical protein N3A64_01870 [Desulfobacterota bacterium]|nr:hypothetical protein [Thermodesulfobacteriota bacterium]
MKNPLLVPEIREMLLANRIEELQDFCISTPPSVVADFLGALNDREIIEILFFLTPESRAVIFVNLDEDIKVNLLEQFSSSEVIEIFSYLSEEERILILQQLPMEVRVKIKNLLLQTQREDFIKLVSQPEEPAKLILPTSLVSEDSLRIDIFKTKGDKLERISRIESDCWINIIAPEKEELNFIAQRFNIPFDFLTASLDLDEIARIEIEEENTLIILKAPFFDETNLDVLYFTVPIGIILTKEIIITICPKQTRVILDFINNKIKNFSTQKRNKFVLQLFLRTNLLFLQYLKQINNAAMIIQKKLEQSSKNKQLIKLLNIQKSLVYFTTSLKSNAFLFERLQKLNLLQINSENEDLFEDIAIESKQAIEMANIYTDILSSTMDAFASIISNNLNIVMKALTLITIILTIPVLLASLYGMNVKLPFQESPYAFFIVIGLSTIFSLLSMGFFIRKKWLEM